MSKFKLPSKLRTKGAQAIDKAFLSSSSVSEFHNKLSHVSDEELTEGANEIKKEVAKISDEDFIQSIFNGMLFFPQQQWYNMIHEVYRGEYGTTEGLNNKIIDVSVSTMLSVGMKSFRETLLHTLRTNPSLLIAGIIEECKSVIDNEEFELIHHGYKFIEKTRQELING